MSPVVPVSRGEKIALALAACGCVLAVPTFAHLASAAPFIYVERWAEMAPSPAPVLVTVAFALAAVGLMQSFGYAALMRRRRFAGPMAIASLSLLAVGVLLDDLHRRIVVANCAPYEPCPVNGIVGVNPLHLIGLIHGLGAAVILLPKPYPRLNEPRAIAGILLALVALFSLIRQTYFGLYPFIGLGIAANLVLLYLFLDYGFGRPRGRWA